jgi:hypothetical protein
MKLNRHNYEEYFILYLDNELNSEDRREVEVFAAANPDLKAELDMLLQTKLSPDTEITFGDKQSLLIRNSSSINMNNYEEWLLSYIDNELTAQETKDVEEFVAKHPAVKKELELFQKTKSQPEAIVFPEKESLYRREEKVRVVAMRWWRIAAAAVLLIGISTTAILVYKNKTGEGNGDGAVAVKDQSKTEQSADNNSLKPPVNEPQVNDEAIAGIEENKNIEPATTIKEEFARKNTFAIKNNIVSSEEKTEQPHSMNEEESPVLAQNDNQKRSTNNLPAPVNNPNVITGGDPDNIIAQTSHPKNNDPSLTNNKGNQKDVAVTSDTNKSFNIQKEEAGKSPDNSDFTFASNDGKKNKLRGFFRKITRTIEKRTNMKATDEDEDRLLIAGLAIKLN